jgi:hypothetical protein
MAANPRLVSTDIPALSWDGVVTFVAKGTIVDIPAGSAMEAAYGLGNLVALPGSETSTSGAAPEDSGDFGDSGGGEDT